MDYTQITQPLNKETLSREELPEKKSALSLEGEVEGIKSGLLLGGATISKLTIKDGYLQSNNYVSGSTGWRIDSGSAEFQNLRIGSGIIVGSHLDATAQARLFTDSTAKTNVEGWQHVTDTTKIDGGDIYANSITLAKLDSTITAQMFTDGTTKTNVEGWKHATDVTKIDGGDIYTSTVTANAISVSFLSALSANLGDVTAGTISTDVLIVGTDVITAERRFNRLDNDIVSIGHYNDGLTETPGAGGSITRSLLASELDSNDATSCSLTSTNLGSFGPIDWDKDMEFTISIKCEAATNQDIFVGINSSFGTTVPADATAVGQHLGFFIQDGTLYASNADGVTQTKNTITGITLTNWNDYRFVFDAGTNCKFYINDVLKQTHTTNLPTGTANTPEIFIGIESQAGVLQYVWIKNNYQAIVNI